MSSGGCGQKAWLIPLSLSFGCILAVLMSRVKSSTHHAHFTQLLIQYFICTFFIFNFCKIDFVQHVMSSRTLYQFKKNPH